jgi:hypothetical protein
VRSLTPRWTAHCRLLSEKDGEWLQEVRATANDGAEGHEMSTTRHHPFNINFEIMPAVHSALPHPLHPLHSMSTNNTIMNDITCSPRRHDADTSTHSRGGLHRRLPYGVRAPLLFVRAVGCCVTSDGQFCSCVLRVHAPLRATHTEGGHGGPITQLLIGMLHFEGENETRPSARVGSARGLEGEEVHACSLVPH